MKRRPRRLRADLVRHRLRCAVRNSSRRPDISSTPDGLAQLARTRALNRLRARPLRHFRIDEYELWTDWF